MAVVGAVARHPSLWPTALRQARRLVPRGWWQQRPFLPVPARRYVEFRLLTQYGDNVRRPDAHDVLNYLRWCREWQRRDP
jgi:hypothetical protein